MIYKIKNKEIKRQIKNYIHIFLLIIVLLMPIFNISTLYRIKEYNLFRLGFKSFTLQTRASDLPLQGNKMGKVITHGEGDPSLYYTITFNDAESMGMIINNITTEINSSLLNLYDIILVDVQGTNWTSNELADLQSWVQNGGSLCIWGGYGSARVNVSAAFNVFYNNTPPEQGFLIINNSYPILQGINIIYAQWPSASINLNISRKDLMTIAWSEDNAPLIVSLQENKGRILWVVDPEGMIQDNFIGYNDNRLFANNSWLWLGGLIENEYSNNFPNISWFLILLNEEFVTIPVNWILIIPIIIGSIIIIFILIFYRKKTKKKTFIKKIL